MGETSFKILNLNKHFKLNLSDGHLARMGQCRVNDHPKNPKNHEIQLIYSDLLKIRTPKNPDFCVFAKKFFSPNSPDFKQTTVHKLQALYINCKLYIRATL